jgi:hypothetical protein
MRGAARRAVGWPNGRGAATGVKLGDGRIGSA